MGAEAHLMATPAGLSAGGGRAGTPTSCVPLKGLYPQTLKDAA